MKCPYCGNQDDRVIDTRSPDSGEFIRRRRECTGCNRRYTTLERVEIALPVVVKADGRREPFNRDKILRGLRLACAKRPVSEDDLNRVADQVEQAAAARGQAEIPGSDVGAIVMHHLRELDDIAYIRFASVYRRFEDVDSLLAEAQDVKATARTSDPSVSLELPLKLD
ncbi:MAG: transcriptional repressor NrdR [Armatimonadetes bacterium]|jgi:transcriptional repressor NrdR|nr:transcriptional repressor NrdR [Armatimonadota bacterium]HOC31065.1 transcriptional regulator NrdR [Armatimonadota bacterium]